ncbi:MAG: DNA translocase FtsK 4TM domain-containing protein, partial [Alphaproteobacteria bacterium]|nr:DNA translocase FtsK 4TM domain-containing protein [Alphaproteobacteria bacterium]
MKRKSNNKRHCPKWLKATISFVIAVFLILSFVSYCPQDNSWNIASGLATQNWMGCFGAWTVDALLQLFGCLAFLWPAAFIVFGIFVLHPVAHVKVRGYLFIPAILMACWLLEGYGVAKELDPSDWLKAGPGGFVGHYLHTWIKTPTEWWWLIPLWAIVIVALLFSLKIPAVKGLTLTGTFLMWLASKLPNKFGSKIKSKLQNMHVRSQVKKITKSTPHAVVKSVAKKKSKTPSVEPDEQPEDDGYELPSSTLLAPVKRNTGTAVSKETMEQTSQKLESVLAQFGVQGKVVNASPGPVVTLYAFEPASG